LRIEPGEIEAALQQHPAIRSAVVVLRQDVPPTQGQRLVAYIVPANDERRTTNDERPIADHRLLPLSEAKGPTTDRQGDKETRGQAEGEAETQHSTLNTQNFFEQSTIYNLQSAIPETPSSILQNLRAFLSDKLPDYMVPGVFVVLDALPLTPNGKIDRRGLPAPEQSRIVPGEQFVAPRDELEEVLAEFWSEVLGLERVGVFDNFFELGGHSLLATQIVSRVQQVLRVELPIDQLFAALTVAALAQVVRANEPTPGHAGKMAGILRRIKRMSAADLSRTLQQKRSGPVKE
jgi:acyl carrier protein